LSILTDFIGVVLSILTDFHRCCFEKSVKKDKTTHKISKERQKTHIKSVWRQKTTYENQSG
jgi:hypothetical protein